MISSQILNNASTQEDLSDSDSISISLSNNSTNSSVKSIDYGSDYEYNKQIVKCILRKSKSSVTKNIPEVESQPKVEDIKTQEDFCDFCNCEHFSDLIINQEINATPDKVFDSIFNNSSKFLNEIANRKNMLNLKVSEDIQESDGKMHRYFFHDYPNAFLGKTAQNTSKINFCIRDKEKQHYSVLYINKTDGIPFANTFVVHIRLCLSQASSITTRMKVSWHIEFTKSLWGMTKIIICKRSLDISQDIMNEYVNLLQQIHKPSSSSSNTSDQLSLLDSSMFRKPEKGGITLSSVPSQSKISYIEDIKLILSPSFLGIIGFSILIVLMIIIINQQNEMHNILMSLSKTQ